MTKATALYTMSPLETAWGWLPGGDLFPPLPPGPKPPPPPIEALEDAIRPSLLRPPCVVLFSGGRDSSLVLAAAMRLARREGYEEPVALTERFPGVQESTEDEWQEHVMDFLGAARWERVDVRDELDLVGPVAAPSLLRHGLVWPPLAHLHGAEYAVARGGSILDGEGGDEVFGGGRLAPLRAVTRRPMRLHRGTARQLAGVVAPAVVRRAYYERHYHRHLDLTWLRPDPRRQLEHAIAADRAAEPLDWRRAVMRHPRIRGVHLAMANLDALAAEYDVVGFHPLLDPRLLAAVTAVGGPLGFTDRSAAMTALFSELLPAAILTRTSKARFNRVVFNEHSRAFVDSWNGDGVDGDLVDPDELRRIWARPEPHGLSLALLQACWLATQRVEVPGG